MDISSSYFNFDLLVILIIGRRMDINDEFMMTLYQLPILQYITIYCRSLRRKDFSEKDRFSATVRPALSLPFALMDRARESFFIDFSQKDFPEFFPQIFQLDGFLAMLALSFHLLRTSSFPSGQAEYSWKICRSVEFSVWSYVLVCGISSL